MKISVFARFRTTHFKHMPGEDEELRKTHISFPEPVLCKGLTEWLAAAFRDGGIPVLDVGVDGIGRTVVIQRKPYLLWVGCLGTPSDYRYSAHVATERSLLNRLLGRHFESELVRKVENRFREIVPRIPEITDLLLEDTGPNDA